LIIIRFNLFEEEKIDMFQGFIPAEERKISGHFGIANV